MDYGKNQLSRQQLAFELNSEFTPKGDQEEAIRQLVNGLNDGDRCQTLLGATGTGKTFTMASVIHHTQRPALIFAHNKTLAAQLCQEFRQFFPDSCVEYFISYYDYYQPEAYVPTTDTYIEKDAQINEEIDRLRHAATQALLTRTDVIIIASVSCIYGLGSPDTYAGAAVNFTVSEPVDMDDVLSKFVEMQFTRNHIALTRGTFRLKGDVLEVQPKNSDYITRIEFFDDVPERIRIINPVSQEIIDSPKTCTIFPATHYIAQKAHINEIIATINKEMEEQVEKFTKENKLIEAQRIKQRVTYDMEMIKEVGYCTGVENYSRYFDRRNAGTPPYTLLDFLPKDAIIFIDESHQTLPQIRAMYNGDQKRKSTLVDFGFRLPSALDNRPLKFDEFWDRVKQVVFVSATPGPFEKEVQDKIVEQVIRPTYIVDPEIEVRPVGNQVDNLIHEIQLTIKKGMRILVTTLTKKMSEDLTGYLKDLKVKVQYIHSGIDALERPEILRELRLGKYDVIVGVNLLREGLDLPEVGLVAILDADKEGFLRSDTSLIQTIGRAARNIDGKVIMYADNITGSMERAIDETNRRRKRQEEYNQQYNLIPQKINKKVHDTVRLTYEADDEKTTKRDDKNSKSLVPGKKGKKESYEKQLSKLEKLMQQYAKSLEFEKAAKVRDEIKKLTEY